MGAGDLAAYLPWIADHGREQPDTAGQHQTQPRSADHPVCTAQGLFVLGGGSRIRTLEGVRRRIYSPLPLAARATRLVTGCTGRW